MHEIEITDLRKFHEALATLKATNTLKDICFTNNHGVSTPVIVNASTKTVLNNKPDGSTVIAVESHGQSRTATVFIFANDTEIANADETGFTQREWYCSQLPPADLYALAKWNITGTGITGQQVLQMLESASSGSGPTADADPGRRSGNARASDPRAPLLPKGAAPVREATKDNDKGEEKVTDRGCCKGSTCSVV